MTSIPPRPRQMSDDRAVHRSKHVSPEERTCLLHMRPQCTVGKDVKPCAKKHALLPVARRGGVRAPCRITESPRHDGDVGPCMPPMHSGFGPLSGSAISKNNFLIDFS